MKKTLNVVLPVKSLAAMIFAGLMCAYIVVGLLSVLINAVFGGDLLTFFFGANPHILYVFPPQPAAIPFLFVVEGLVVAFVVAVLWTVLLGDGVIKKMRRFARLIFFSISLFVVMVVCIALFSCLPDYSTIPYTWGRLWGVTTALVVLGTLLVAIVGEIYFKATGKRYTKALEMYKAEHAE
ncbi:MAG: hypothetical protein FWF49_05535 [Oscillospiraceae bacterium]|nr:hypothetical protein [Oscillospiraceae bacterium]